MIRENVARILEELPEGVELVAAAKTRTAEEILEAVEAGLRIVGENYLQEAEEVGHQEDEEATDTDEGGHQKDRGAEHAHRGRHPQCAGDGDEGEDGERRVMGEGHV